MRINLDFEYDKLHLKEIIILIPKYHHNLVSFLTPILGLYGINVKEFINEFESKTKFIDFDIIIPTRVKISKIKTFQITLKTPYISSILANFSNRSFSNALTIYKLTLLKSLFMNYMVNYQQRIYFSIRKYMFRTLKSPFLTLASISLNKSPTSEGFLKLFKSSLNNLAFFKAAAIGKFGVFVAFNNVNNTFLNHLKPSLSLFNISISKVPSKLLSSIVGRSYFQTNVYSISSINLSNSISFLSALTLKNNVSNLLPIFFKFGTNLVTKSFCKSIITSFYKVGNYLSVLKILHYMTFKNLKLLNHLNKRVIFAINYKNSCR